MIQPRNGVRAISRRGFLRAAALALAGVPAARAAVASGAPGFGVPYRRIATEEAFITADVAAAFDRLLAAGGDIDPGFAAMWRGIGTNAAFRSRLIDMGDGRIADMDSTGIAMQVLSLTAPGVQVFDADTATSLAIACNDQLHDAIAARPDRLAGLAAIAPQRPPAAAREMERGIRHLGLNGVIVNSHTNGEYLDDPRYWEIFEAAEALGAPIYIHPRPPPPSMIGPYLARGLSGPLGGFAAEVFLHVMAIITAGVFDRFPQLKLVIGHLGEGLPYMMYRLDYMQYHAAAPGLRGRAEPTRLERRISDYLKTNVWVTTSGMAWEPAIRFALEVLGPDRVMYAMDYPYQFDADEVLITDRLAIDDADKLRLYQTTAERLFSLRRPAPGAINREDPRR